MNRWLWLVLLGVPYAFFMFIFVLGAIYVDPWLWSLVVLGTWIGYECYEALIQILQEQQRQKRKKT